MATVKRYCLVILAIGLASCGGNETAPAQDSGTSTDVATDGDTSTDTATDGGTPVPWTRRTYGAVGAYDLPLLTFWDGTAWDPLGVVPFAGGMVAQYDCYPWEITGRGLYGTATPYGTSEMEAALDAWYAVAGVPIEVFNHPSDMTMDGSSSAIQILPMMPTGAPIEGSATPACDDNGDGTHNLGQGLFGVVLPPGFDASRSTPYPVLVTHPGAGLTHSELLLRATEDVIPQLARVMSESVQNGGGGVILLVGNSGGQGSIGLNFEYTVALNTAMQQLATDANADLTRVVTWGGSRGATTALFHGSHAARVYSVEAAFASAPVTMTGSLLRLRLNFLPLQENYQVHTCWTDPDCANSWRWDHVPAPGEAPYNAAGSLVATTDWVIANDRSPWGWRTGWDDGAWVELCSGPRDYVSGVGHTLEYYDHLPATVSKRFNQVIGSGHGGHGTPCDDHMMLYVLDKLAGNSAYSDRFDAEVATGLYYSRLTLWDATPYDADAGELEPLQLTGCGARPPVLLLPRMQQWRQSDGAMEPSHFVLTGEPGRVFKVELTTAPGSTTAIHSWAGVLGADVSTIAGDCEYHPLGTSTHNILCRWQTGLDLCTGPSTVPGAYVAACGWRFFYDCDGNGTPEEIPATFTPQLPQGEPELWATVLQCSNFASCMIAPPPAVMPPWEGVPMSITPCLNPARTDCSPLP